MQHGLTACSGAVDAARVIDFEVEIVRRRLRGEQRKEGDLVSPKRMIAAGIHVARAQVGERPNAKKACDHANPGELEC